MLPKDIKDVGGNPDVQTFAGVAGNTSRDSKACAVEHRPWTDRVWLGRENMQIKLLMIGSVSRNGHICKPAAIANVDRFYSDILQVENIPLNKNRHNYYPRQINFHARRPANLSVREIAKRFDSVQGEVLQFQDVVSIAREMGYQTKELPRGSLAEFKDCIFQHLMEGNPVIVFFPVSSTEDDPKPNGHPSFTHPENEHAGVVVGMNKGDDTVGVAHWGNIWSFNIEALYRSMDTLPVTKPVEIYERTTQVPTRFNRASPQSVSYYKWDLGPVINWFGRCVHSKTRAMGGAWRRQGRVPLLAMQRP